MAEQHTFVFADLAGYTALTEAHGDHHAADLVGDFCRSVRERLPEHGAEEVKTIGDAVMIRTPTASAAARLAVQIAREVGGRHGFPHVRVGLHTGPAIQREGDWYGATVNTASRVCAAARPGHVLATAATVAALGDAEALEIRPLGRRRLKNVAERVELFALTGSHGDRMAIDPVCRMAVDPAAAAEAIVYRRREYHFCSAHCADAFRRRPSRYARRRR